VTTTTSPPPPSEFDEGIDVSQTLVASLRRASVRLAWLSLLLGALVLVGWRFEIGFLMHLAPGMGAMAPGTALCLALAGLDLLLLQPSRSSRGAQATARVLPILIAALGVTTLCEYAFGVDLGIDQLLFADNDRSVQTSHPGRISIIASFELSLLGIALWLESGGGELAQAWARGLALVCIACSMFGLLGFLYGQSALYSLPVFNGLALHTVLGLFLVCASLLSIQPARGLPSLLVSSGPGGTLGRRLLPAAALVPMGLGWLRVEGEQLGVFQSAMGVDLMTVAMIWLFFLLIWWNAHLLDAASRETSRAQADLRAQAEEIRDLYENAPCGYHSLDVHGLVLRMNATELGWLGYAHEEVVGRRHFFELMTPAGQAVFQREFPRFVAQGEIRDVELEMQRKDGSALCVSINASAIRDTAGQFVMSRSTVFDITARKRVENALRDSEAAIRELALTDALTGIANRRRLDEALRAELNRVSRYGGRVSVVMADLDWFKRVNDEYGHAVGDAVLQRFAQLIRRQCRDTDLAARFGGEEFLVLMPEAGAKEAAAWAERVRVLQERELVPPQRLPITATFGVAEYSPGEDAEGLLHRVDDALYRGKSAGRNRVQLASDPALA
jgi:diguanylate cyclase (GGDEF)-like protein/PAS domain S-box-containing protein